MVQSAGRELTVLGIDPGTTRMGFAVVAGNPLKPRLVESGVFGDTTVPQGNRLLLLFTKLNDLIKRANPDFIAVERLFFSKNVKTAFQVAEARGIILLTAQMADRTVYEYAPNEVKIAVTGAGNADKTAVGRMAELMLKTPRPRYDDESDAIAVALTGLASQSRYRMLKKVD